MKHLNPKLASKISLASCISQSEEQVVNFSENSVFRENTHLILGPKSKTVWFTGLSGSGKSTLAFELQRRLYDLRLGSFVLDGDNIRHGLNSDLGFSSDDRKENIRRIAEVSKLFNKAGMLTINALISPYSSLREMARLIIGPDQFIEVYLSTKLSVCEERDPKGLYRKARSGFISHFTGIDDPYEPPASPMLTLDTARLTVDECVARLLDLICGKIKICAGN